MPRLPLLLLAAVLAAATPSAAAQPAEAGGMHPRLEEVLAGGEFQTELPGHDAEAGTVSQGRERERGDGLRRGLEGLGRVVAPLARLLDGLLAVLPWLVLALGVVLLLLLLARESGRWLRYRKPATVPRAEPPQPAAPAPPPELTEIEALAGRGDFAAAAHLLLLRTLRHLAECGQARVAAAATSREVLRSVTLPAESRDALGTLVATVERGHFGGVELSTEDWQRSLESHRRLTGVEAAA